MTDDGVDAGLFGAEFELDSDDGGKDDDREKRTFQSEEEFLQQKKEWVPKVENRETLLQSVATIPTPKTKFDILTLKSAAELLYYSRDYSTALEVGQRVLKAAKEEETYLSTSERNEVDALVGRCRRRLGALSGEAE